MPGEEDFEEATIVTLVGEDGEETDFEMLAVIEVDGADYALLTPYDEDAPEDAEMDIHIFGYSVDDDGNETFAGDLDDETFAKVQAAAEALFDGGDDEDES